MGTGLIVHGGKLIYEWGDTTFPNDAASATKFFYTFLTLRAIEEGRIDSLDDPVVKWVPELMDLNADLGHKDRDITFRHLLNQTSGYGLSEPPGERFAYNDHATSLLAWILFFRVYDREPMQYDEVLNSEVFRDWMGLEHHFTAIHRNTPRGRLRISARDLARIGLLHHRNGRWENRQIIDENRLQAVFDKTLPMDLPRTRGVDAEEIPGLQSLGGGKDEKNHLGCLGYFWWHNHLTPDGTRLLEAAPPNTRLVMGYGGKFVMALIPDYDLIIVWFDVYRGEAWSPFDEIGRHKVNDMFKELLAARSRAE
ncbi:MAG: serine hydrolase [Verrucomicrobia bacterium]|nr:serine hydrolase [Verrucomicrobiota bacterium]MCH8510290.1 serine hydrolase [Kiritimatiellia bacterium]